MQASTDSKPGKYGSVWLLKWVRVVPRRRSRLLKASVRRWNGTTGRDIKKRAHEASSQAAERALHEIDDVRIDSRRRYEEARPHIHAAVINTRIRALQTWRFSVRVVKLTLSVVASIILLTAIGLALYFLLRDTNDTVLACSGCPELAVTAIIDGDTIDTDIGRIRIYGADTPEIGQPCYSEATETMRRLAGDTVRTERGPRHEDVFGRNLYYLYTASGESIDELLIRNGLARAWTQDGQHRDLLMSLQQVAERENAGCLW